MVDRIIVRVRADPHVDTPQGFHIDETETDTGTTTWSDGSYSIIEAVDHLTPNIFDCVAIAGSETP